MAKQMFNRTKPTSTLAPSAHRPRQDHLTAAITKVLNS